MPDCARAAVCTLVSAALLSGNPDSEVATAASGSLLAVAKADQIKRSAGWLLAGWLAALLLVPLPRVRALARAAFPPAAHERVVRCRRDAEASERARPVAAIARPEPLVMQEWWCQGPGLLGD